VDVFFIHPTTFTDRSRTEEFNADLTEDSLNIKTDYTSILYQASVFNADCRIFAPRYRQAHIGMYTYTDTASAMRAFDTAYADIRAAFLHYLEHYKGRPIIIAAHSQGTQHATRLLKEFFDGKTLGNRLVAAYLLGIPVGKSEFENIPVCRDSTQTGCFVSWRTFRKDFEGPEYLSGEAPKAVVNPLSWRADSGYAPSTLHKGAILYNFNKLIKAPNDAQVHNNILWISRPKFPGASFYKSKNYHAGDYNLFYRNIREDIRRRIGLFWKK
jgi:pimeloyl-ACP methyl ester carboxylesterase